MKYFIMYLKLRITLFIATHFYMEPEYLNIVFLLVFNDMLIIVFRRNLLMALRNRA